MTITTTAKVSKKINIRAGDLKHCITIQLRKLEAPISSNKSFRATYTDVKELWSAVKANQPTFPFSKTNIDESITHFFYIRYDDKEDITKDNWILFDNIRYKIISTRDPDFERKWVELSCIEKGDISEESSKW